MKPPEPGRPIRFVSAASLFDGHDAAINMIRRLLQSGGAEVVHLGHNPLHDLDRTGRSRHDAGTQTGEIEALEVGVIEERDEHRRHAMQAGAALLLDRVLSDLRAACREHPQRIGSRASF